MSVTDVFADWSSTAADNVPVGGATPEIDDEFRNIKAQVKGNAVALSGNQTVAGVKTFTSFPVTPSSAPTTDYQTANKKYVDDGFVADTGDQSVAGIKTFASFPVTPSSAPTTDYQVANKKYVDDSVLTDTIRNAYYMRYSDKKDQNTGGGDTVATTLTTRVLNTEDADVGGIGSVGTNKITIPAGTYYIHARSPFVNCGYCRIALYNETTGPGIIQWGNNCLAANGYNGFAVAEVKGYFTVAVETEISIKYYAQSAVTNGLGFVVNYASLQEEYTVVELWKLA